MNKKPSIEGQEKDPSWEEAVGRYLEQTPDYFLRHPELLAALALPHPEAGRAVSLVERQVRVLRDRNEQSTHQLQELIVFARDNDQLGERVQRFALAMIDSDSLDEVLDTAQDMLRQEFSLDGVAVRLTGNPRPACPRQEFVTPDDAIVAPEQEMNILAVATEHRAVVTTDRATADDRDFHHPQSKPSPSDNRKLKMKKALRRRRSAL